MIYKQGNHIQIINKKTLQMKNLSLATLALIGGAAAYTDAENTETRTCVDGYTLDQTYDYIANGSCSQVEVASQTDVLTFEGK